MWSRTKRVVHAMHGRRAVVPDPPEEIALAEQLRAEHSRAELSALASRYAWGDTDEDDRMRRACWRALAKRFGHGVRIGRGALAKHLETCEIGHGVFVGEHAFIQGRFDGTCVIGDNVWIGPQSYLDARDLVIESYVGWGPGARVLGSQHTGMPIDVPIIETDLVIRPVRIGAWADVGVNAVVLPGITIGKGAIVGAGAVVTRSVKPFSIVVGVPARFLRWRDGHDPSGKVESGKSKRQVTSRTRKATKAEA
jgi:acetyltransferase-like isoleucine patch superfamily enzyme